MHFLYGYLGTDKNRTGNRQGVNTHPNFNFLFTFTRCTPSLFSFAFVPIHSVNFLMHNSALLNDLDRLSFRTTHEIAPSHKIKLISLLNCQNRFFFLSPYLFTFSSKSISFFRLRSSTGDNVCSRKINFLSHMVHKKVFLFLAC